MLKKILLYHLFPLTLALFIAAILYHIFESQLKQENQEIILEKELSEKHIYNLASSPILNEKLCSKALEEGTIFIIGSSELQDRSTDYQPDTYIPNTIGYPAVSLGHAGNQNFSIHSTLAGLYDKLDGSKIVIIESPGWFESKSTAGTSVESFLEYSTENILKSSYFNPDLPESTRNEIAYYISTHFADINSPSSIIELYFYYHQSQKSWMHRISYAPLIAMTKLIMKLESFFQDDDSSRSIETSLTDSVSTYEINTTLNWDSIYQRTRSKLLDNITTNNYGISDDYYLKYMNGKKSNIRMVDFKHNKEFYDFKALLAFLNSKDCEVTLIIQALNPHAYNHIQDMQPVVDSLTNEMDKYGFPYLNLFVSDTAKYEKGILKDIMHMGDYGWMLSNRFIYENLVQNEK